MVRPATLFRTEPEGKIVLCANGEDGKERVTKPLKITNSSEDVTLAWKVRTTAPEAFLVQPRSGLLKPGESAEAVVTKLPGLPADASSLPRFEVRAAAVDATRELVTREDWTEIRASVQEVAYLVAVVRPMAQREHLEATDDGHGASMRRRGQASSSGARSRGRGAMEDVDEVMPSFSYGEWEDECSGFRPAASSRARNQSQFQSRASSRLEDDEGPERRDSPTSARGSGGKGELQPGQMGPATKALLGVLIAVLFFNLYLKPLVQQLASK